MRYLRRMKDFDMNSVSSSSTTSIMTPNGVQEITTKEETRSSEENKVDEPREEETKIEVKETDTPDKIYEDSTEESHTFKELTPELRSEQNQVAREAKKSMDLEKFIRSDFSYEYGDEVPYKGTIYKIVDVDNPADAEVTPETMKEMEDKEADEAFESYLKMYGL